MASTSFKKSSKEFAASQNALDFPPLPGYRLHRLEVLNWGTFDGKVYSLDPCGQTTLLVGENGSGKSTLVDAILTLLVRPQVRNYNVAAGASKNERDERTYIRGAHDRLVGADGRPQIQYLRPSHGHFTVLLATFHHAARQKSFTLCQVLYLNHEQGVERIYAYGEGDFCIAKDLAGLTAATNVAKQLRARGLETATSYQQYFQWLQRAMGFRPKAMDIFNQTVAVKDVQRLDAFIRQHMLEKQPWNERIAKLLTHFTELSEAHAILVRIRLQKELLEPIVQSGRLYRDRERALRHQEQLLESIPYFFANAKERLLQPFWERLQEQIRYHTLEMQRLGETIQSQQKESLRMEVELEGAADDRLRMLPAFIEQANRLGENKKKLYQRMMQAVEGRSLGPVQSAQQFHQLRSQLQELLPKLHQEKENNHQQWLDLQRELGALSQVQHEEERELRSLAARHGNLPEALIQIRDRMAQALKLKPQDLPFAAELVEVLPEQQEWTASIEQVLFSFARSLLVPEQYYRKVAEYLDRERLVDQRGHGQRLVYLRVLDQEKISDRAMPRHRLPGKLGYRNHPLSGWVRAEIEHRFDYLACESMEDFQHARGAAMTRNRHFKSNEVRHTKDDRQQGNDVKHYVLGWDNQSKKASLLDSIGQRQRIIQSLQNRMDGLRQSHETIIGSIESVNQVLKIEDFDSIDYFRHEVEAKQLQQEKYQWEHASDRTRELRRRAELLLGEAKALQEQRDQQIAAKTALESEALQGERLLRSARQLIDRAKKNGGWEQHFQHFAAIEKLFAEPLSIENLGLLPDVVERNQRVQVEALRSQLAPLVRDVTHAMTRYVRQFPESQTDLDPELASLDGFIALYDQLAGDDLPRHEERFKNRLNESVLHEVGLLYGTLENDRQEIRDKIEQLNKALQMLEWKKGTHMRLEAIEVADREIQEFRKELAHCLSTSMDGTPESNEATFVRIEKLVGRLRSEEQQRWREKVIDVRNWFQFAAQEVVSETGERRSYYDGGTGQSGGEKGKLAFLVLVAAIAYQYNIDPMAPISDRFHFVMVDEMFSRSDDLHAEYALDLFQKFGLQLLIVAPLDSKVRVTEPYVGTYVHVTKDRESHRSSVLSMTSEQLTEATHADSADVKNEA